ncbi:MULTISPECIES: helix-turn-helix domain-containing protein [Aquimarina]|uniref:HTH domain-containing protein n=1 Tax=Aquimarina algiphila TaxID=2047982 RepID=A0A554VNW7_9FLAO|nr:MULTISPECIES: helix-turn-helix domain-containing protein [Aquimarina]TSE10095.1 hypothetical protein FOF46_06095 [Aquimarina algiphila]
MKILIQTMQLIQRIDQLIHLQATGTPDQLASRLGISRTKVYRIIKFMKDLDAPILYDLHSQNFIYAEAVGFRFGFYQNELQSDE